MSPAVQEWLPPPIGRADRPRSLIKPRGARPRFPLALYLLVENYRGGHGYTRRCTRCYLGRERERRERAIERLRPEPSEESARAAERAFVWLAKRHYPDDSGRSHQGSVRVEDAYARVVAAWTGRGR